jgi:hypothetical protein
MGISTEQLYSNDKGIITEHLPSNNREFFQAVAWQK